MSVENGDIDDFDESDHWDSFDLNIAQMAEAIPNIINNRMHDILHNEATSSITKLADAFEHCYIMHWKIFALSVLNISKGDVENIDEDYRGRAEKVSHCF